MRARQTALQLELQRAGFALASPQSRPGSPRTGHLPGEMAAAINHLAASFGALPGARFAPGAWDIALTGGILVELDEQSHFTRYRAASLGFPWSPFLPWHGPYGYYCPAFEYRALTHGGYWANRSSTIMFGGADSARGLWALRFTALEAARRVRRHQGCLGSLHARIHAGPPVHLRHRRRSTARRRVGRPCGPGSGGSAAPC